MTQENIQEQVERICNDSDLKSKKLICSFLRFVVNETLDGRGEQLKAYTIAINVLGRETGFDPEQDSLVRIHAGRLRRILHLYYLESGKDDEIIIEIPKGGYKPIFSIKGIASLPAENIPPSIIRDPSVAVIPFKNLTSDPAKEYFAYGFSEELSIELTKYDDLRVINCWQRPEPGNSPGLYSQVGAHYLIDGYVQLYEQEVRILVKLIDTSSGGQLWAERYSRDTSIDSLIFIQEDIAEEVAKTIGSEVGIVMQSLFAESNRIKAENIDTLDAILQFYYYESHVSENVGAITFQKLHQALTTDPDSGVIHAMIANLYGNAYALDYAIADNAFIHMVDYAEKAIELEPYNLTVRLIYCFKCFLKGEKDRFSQEAEHCLKMKMVSPFRQGILGFHLSLFGEWEQGKKILDKAMNKQIGFPSFFYGVTCLYFYRQEKYLEAYSEAEKYDMPGLFWGPMLRAACLGKLNQKNEASPNIEALLNLKPEFPQKAEYLISRFVKENDLVIKIMDGLTEAGLAVPMDDQFSH